MEKEDVTVNLRMTIEALKEQVDRLYAKLEERDNELANAVNEQILLAKELDSFRGYKRIEDVVADAIRTYQKLMYEGKDWATWLTVSEMMIEEKNDEH